MAITRTKIFPVEGQSPIVLHNVPQSVELVGDVTGDKGTNEVWDDTKRIEDFEVKITTLDEYSTGKPHKVIKRVDTLNESTGAWTEGTQETYEASEKTFNLSYKGHERDFEVKVVEGEGGASVPSPIVYTIEGDSCYIYEIAPIEESWKDGYDHTWYSDVFDGDFHKGADLIGIIEDAELDASALQSDKWYALTFEALSEDILTDNNLKFTDGGEPIEGSHLTFIANGSSPKLQIRYRWGMSDSHDLSVEKNITITERPRPVEPEEGGDDDIPKLGMSIRQWVEENAVIPYILKWESSSSNFEGFNVLTGEWEEFTQSPSKGTTHYLDEPCIYSKVRMRGATEELPTERLEGYTAEVQSKWLLIPNEAVANLLEVLGQELRGSIYFSSGGVDVLQLYSSSDYPDYYECGISLYDIHDDLNYYNLPISTCKFPGIYFQWNDEEGYISSYMQNNLCLDQFFSAIWYNLHPDEGSIYDPNTESYSYYLPSSVVSSFFPNMNVNEAVFGVGERTITLTKQGDEYHVYYEYDYLTCQSVKVDGVSYMWDTTIGIVGEIATPYTSFNYSNELKANVMGIDALYIPKAPYLDGYEPCVTEPLYMIAGFKDGDYHPYGAFSSSYANAEGIPVPEGYWGIMIDYTGSSVNYEEGPWYFVFADSEGGMFYIKNGEHVPFNF